MPLRTESPLHVALVAPPWFEIPPETYGGIEAVVAALADHLVRRGHDVLLVGAGRDLTSARFAQTYDVPPSEALGQPLPDLVQAAASARILRAELCAGRPVDLVHDHCLAGALLAVGRDVPTIVTMHGAPEGDLLRYFREVGEAIGLVAISDAQRRSAPDLPWVGTVHNAIDVSAFPFRGDKEDVVVWAGRYCPDKAPHLVIDAAREVDLPVVLAGKKTERCEHDYYTSEIEPRLGADVLDLGLADFRAKASLLGRGRCLVFPIRWEEPFGLVMIETMACGTPVVAFRRGAVPEVVVDGVTGFVVDEASELPEAIRESKTLDPSACRHHVEQHFDLTVMVNAYEQVYRSVLSARARVDGAERRTPAGTTPGAFRSVSPR